jgi:hypothetical protein
MVLSVIVKLMDVVSVDANPSEIVRRISAFFMAASGVYFR